MLVSGFCLSEARRMNAALLTLRTETTPQGSWSLNNGSPCARNAPKAGSQAAELQPVELRENWNTA